MLSKTTMTYLITTFRHVNLSQEIDRCTVYIYASNRDSSSPTENFKMHFIKWSTTTYLETVLNLLQNFDSYTTHILR